jgi:hypothetical protein
MRSSFLNVEPMALHYVANSRCECQAALSAELTADRFVIDGAATLRGARERSPAHTIGSRADRFDIGWLCPFCGRNTLRTFYVSALGKIEVPDPPPPAAAT